MNGTLPPLLFRFRSLNPSTKNYAKALIEQSTLYFSDPANLNDPYDCQLMLDSNGSEQEWRRHVSYALKRNTRKISIQERIRLTKQFVDEGRHQSLDGSLFSRITSTFGVSCFSSTMNNLLLWAHYADQHRGICLIYQPENDVSGLLRTAFEVQYQAQLPRVRIVDLPSLDEMAVKSLLLTKSSDWKYEQEYRILLPRAAKQSVPFSPSALIGIVLGAKISESDEKEVLKWTSGHPYRPIVHRARLTKSVYGVAIDPAFST